MTRTVQETIDKLSRLDLSTYPTREIQNAIGQLGICGGIVKTFRRGEVIIRARINYDSEVMNKTSQLSYKPAKFNTTFQRANTPNTTMFYGAIFQNDAKSIEFARLVGVMEVCKFMRDKTITEGEQKITFGRWIVSNDFHVVSIIHHNEYLEQNFKLKEMHTEYLRFIHTYPKDIVDDSLMISEFFADQFARSQTPNDYDYLLSALYSEKITTMKNQLTEFSGVLYPSVRAEGKGFNVAITPWCADNCLELDYVSECTIYKKGHKTMVDNDKQAVLRPGQKHFVLEPITDPTVHAGREAVYKILNSDN